MLAYGLKLAGAAAILLVAGVAAILVFEDLWARVGIGAAIAVVIGGLLLFAWIVDRRDRAKRAGLEDLPPV